MNSTHWKIWVDTGGTFTDGIAISPQGDYKRLKVLSNAVLRVPATLISPTRMKINLPIRCSKDFLAGFTIRRGNDTRTVLQFDAMKGEIEFNSSFPKHGRHTIVEITSNEEVPVFAARLLTETSLGTAFPMMEIKLGSTRGTNALLERKGARTAFLVTKGFKDLVKIGSQQRRALFSLNIEKIIPLYSTVLEVNERIESDGQVITPLDDAEVDRIINTLIGKKIESVAVAFLHSYLNPVHEQRIGQAIERSAIKYVSLSHELSTQIKILTRAQTTIVNAYLEPIIHRYISRIREVLPSSTIKVMTSAGGLISASAFRPKDSLLSGPAGGVIGALAKARQSGTEQIITFDMGGTSTDVSRCRGNPQYRFTCNVGDQEIFAPSLAVETIAAGGGSICSYDGYRLTVGPESAGASPGPACYGAHGPLTITDVNLLLGRLDARNFSIPVSSSAAARALDQLLTKSPGGTDFRREEVLESFVAIANEKMAEAIRKISIRQGQDPADYSLVCFGGAGGQHACALANLLQIHRIIIPYEAGLLSAFGIGNARVERVKERQILDELPAVAGLLDRYFDELTLEATKDLNEETGRRKIKVITSRKIYLRLKGQETSLALEYNGKDRLRAQFIREYKKLYGHWIRHRVIEVDSLRVITSAHTDNKTRPGRRKKKYYPQEERFTETYTNGRWARCPVFTWENLEAGAQITGPALILSENSTIFLEMGWHFNLDDNQNANLSLIRTYKHNKTTSHAAALELFTNRFTAVAEEMGTLLQRSSFSVNVKERLDFSCALLDAKGNLVVNAPHIPVHLGSLGVCVRSVIKTVKLRDGDVIITNHPAFGGSHLPDITLIKPIYYKQQLIAFVANRAHHAEIGGTKPGSMPADAHTLEEEGVVIRPRFLVKNGFPQWKELEKILTLARYPTRSLRENLADINGALAAVTLGETAVRNLCNKYGAGDVVYYMKSLRKYATDLMRQRIDSLGLSYRAQQRLDNGAKLKVDIAKRNNKLTIDFSGSAHVNSGNLNATIAIVNSVVLYTLRLLIDQPVPLNEGLLTPIKLIIPAGMLNPTFRNDDSKSPAVVGGNTEVSQRLTDTLLKALRLAACSQGTMNNLLFGNAEFGYYETIAGGVGAGPGFHGADAVHQHMTNTRITDPEILEHRYPVRLEKFEIRKGSGGRGKWRGGNGILRELYFKESLDVNLLSQHRVEAPYGMFGGDPGRVGSQYLIKGDNRQIHLVGISGFQVSSGDKLIIKTPGGGGWGKK